MVFADGDLFIAVFFSLLSLRFASHKARGVRKFSVCQIGFDLSFLFFRGYETNPPVSPTSESYRNEGV